MNFRIPKGKSSHFCDVVPQIPFLPQLMFYFSSFPLSSFHATSCVFLFSCLEVSNGPLPFHSILHCCSLSVAAAVASFICYITYVHPPSDPIQVCYFYALISHGSALIIAILLRAFLISCQNQNRTQFPNENVSISICNFTLTKSPIVASFWKSIALLAGL